MTQEGIPAGVLALPVDPDRHVPVPWFVAWVKGKPDFRLADDRRLDAALARELCWVCGHPMGRFRAFNIGPMCAVNRISAEPPSHRGCAVFSALRCPFLANPRAVRRTTGLSAEVRSTMHEPPGIMLRRNPGVALVWVTKRYQVERHPGGVLVHLGDPTEALWFAQGRPATRAEVLCAIASGYPALLDLAEAESPAAVVALEQMRDAAMRWVPA